MHSGLWSGALPLGRHTSAVYAPPSRYIPPTLRHWCAVLADSVFSACLHWLHPTEGVVHKKRQCGAPAGRLSRE